MQVPIVIEVFYKSRDLHAFDRSHLMLNGWPTVRWPARRRLNVRCGGATVCGDVRRRLRGRRHGWRSRSTLRDPDVAQSDGVALMKRWTPAPGRETCNRAARDADGSVRREMQPLPVV